MKRTLPTGIIRKVLLLLSLVASLTVAQVSRAPGIATEHIRVTRVIDGDTLELENGQRVRLIGVDTPEIHDNPKMKRDMQHSGKDEATLMQMGRESARVTTGLVLGKDVRLEFDVEKHDRYGRLLAYVYLPDGKSINEEIVREGYAVPMTIPPNVRYAGQFRELYKRAREAEVGLWQADKK